MECETEHSSTYPISWNRAEIFPILKRLDSSDPNNYRPISPTFIISKVLEINTSGQLRAFLERDGLLSDR